MLACYRKETDLLVLRTHFYHRTKLMPRTARTTTTTKKYNTCGDDSSSEDDSSSGDVLEEDREDRSLLQTVFLQGTKKLPFVDQS